MQPFGFDLGVFGVGFDLERQPVTEIFAARGPQPLEHGVRIAEDTKVDIPSRSCTRDAEFERGAAFQYSVSSQDAERAVEEPFENQDLAKARQIGALLRGACAESVLECRAECKGCGVLLPHRIFFALLRSRAAAASRRATSGARSPRRLDCEIAWRTSSGSAASWITSRIVRSTVVIGIEWNHARSDFDTSA